MRHPLDINKQTSRVFIRKAQEFLNLPRRLWQCDIDKCNPKLYKGLRGKTAIKRAKIGIRLLKRIDTDFKKIINLLK